MNIWENGVGGGGLNGKMYVMRFNSKNFKLIFIFEFNKVQNVIILIIYLFSLQK